MIASPDDYIADRQQSPLGWFVICQRFLRIHKISHNAYTENEKSKNQL